MNANIKTILFLALAATVSSCDDFFEPAIENQNQINLIYDDLQSARGILGNAYILLPYNNNIESDLATDDAVTNDLNNDYYKITTGAWNSENNPFNGQWRDRYHAIQYCNIGLEEYDKVHWSLTNPALHQMYHDLYVGNCYAMRALQYYYLLRTYAGMSNGKMLGVTIRKSSETQDSEFNLPRKTFAECVQFILSDLDEAEKLLPETYANISLSQVPAKYMKIYNEQMQGQEVAPATDYNRAFGEHQAGKIDRKIIDAIRAQVMLLAASPAYINHSGISSQQAAQAAEKALQWAGGLSGVAQDGYNWFGNQKEIDNLASGVNPQEIVWRDITEERNNFEEDQFPPSVWGKGRVNPTQNLVDAFPMANGYPIDDPRSGYDPSNPYQGRDARFDAYIIHNGSTQGNGNSVINTASDAVDGNGTPLIDGLNHENSRSTRTGYYLRKFTSRDVSCNPNGAVKKKHYTSRIRFTELYLDFAEAANEAWGPNVKGPAGYSAAEVMTELRKRAGIGANGAGDPYLYECSQDKDKMRQLIRNERRLELCFEGHRFWDLRRWQVDFSELIKPAMGVNITTDGSTGNLKYDYFTVDQRNYKEYMYFCPIPYSEIRKYDKLEQNDKW